MAVRKYKPTTPGRRGASVSTFDELTRAKPEKSLVTKGRNKAGRNMHGRITARHQGGGTKRRYRVDRLPAEQGRGPGQGRAHRVRPEPERSHRAVALPRRREALHPGSRRRARSATCSCRGPTPRSAPGNALPLRNIPVGHRRACDRAEARGGAKMARSAGASVQLMAKEGAMATLRLPSGEMRWSRRVQGDGRDRSATPSTSWSRLARQAATGGRASAPPSAASR